MSGPAPPAPTRGEDGVVGPGWGGDLRRVLPVALRRGAVAAGIAFALGQVPPLAANLAGAGMAVETQLRLGWLYAAAANAASIGIGEDGRPGASSGFLGSATVRVALLSITFALVWVLVRAGAAAASRATDRPFRRGVAGATVAIAYAAPFAVAAPWVMLTLHTGGGLWPEVVTLRAVPGQAIAFPAVLAAGAGAIGGLHTTAWWRGRAGIVLAAGWRAFAVAVAGSLLGLLVFAALRPAGLDAYARGLTDLGPRSGALAAGHQILVLPNQAAWVLSASMGACGTVAVDGERAPFLCLDRFPAGPSPAAWAVSTLDGRPASPTRPAPAAAWLFLLVPAIAVAAGARGLGETAGPRSAAVRAAGAAVVFAVLVAGLAWAATVVVTMPRSQDGGSRRIEIGPRALDAGVHALAWGVVAGPPVAALTAVVRARRRGREALSPASPR